MLENPINIFENNSLEQVFNDKVFCDAWDNLFFSCPWATVFQSRDFVTSWLECFHGFSPIIITDWNGSSMAGLWVLVKANGGFTAPGFDLAEYQVWIALPQENEGFITKALAAFSNKFPKEIIHLKYIPDPNQMEVFGKNQMLAKHTAWKAYDRPMMEADKEWLQKELKKKNRKEKLNRLNRIGELKFEQVTDLDLFKSLIDEMALQSDFRKGALYNKTFFHDEPQRKDFLLRLFELGHLHVTTLTVGNTLIASNAGIMSKDMLHLQGINSHSPYFSKHSPGILHFLMLGVAISDSQVHTFDLTPGGADGYKAVLANKQDVAYEFWYGPQPYILQKKASIKLKSYLKSKLHGKKLFNIDLSDLLVSLSKLKENFFRNLSNQITLNKKERKNFIINQKAVHQFAALPDFQLSIGDANTTKYSEALIISKNKISDLFLWDNKNSGFTRMQLFYDCLTRIENGQEMFTFLFKGKLIAISWLIPPSPNKNVNAKNVEQDQIPPHYLTCSYYRVENVDFVEKWINDMVVKNPELPSSEEFILELANEQIELKEKVLKSGIWNLDKSKVK
jgi:CelD/BcsL family acetyltransferase involved in cellulose biosynthesis